VFSSAALGFVCFGVFSIEKYFHMNFFFFVGKIAIFCYLFATLKIVQKFFSAFVELQRRERERERERERR